MGEKYSKKESINKPPSHINNINREVPKMRLKVNLSNIMKDVIKKNTIDNSNTCIIKSNVRNQKVIRNIINRKNNKNLNGQKIMIYKKIKDDKNIFNQSDIERNYRLINMFDNKQKINNTNKKFLIFSVIIVILIIKVRQIAVIENLLKIKKAINPQLI